MKKPLKYQAAKLAMGKLNSDEIKATIHDLVDDGLYLEEFAAAFDAGRPRMDDVEPALLAAFRSAGIVVPDKEQAVWVLIEHHVERIASGSDEPLKALCDLMADVYWDYDFAISTKNQLGDSHGIEHFVGLYWDVDDVHGRASDPAFIAAHGDNVMDEISQQVVARAKDWLVSRPRVR